MGIRQDQCNKVCRIIDDYLANRPRERDELIVAVRTVFKEADRKTENSSEKPNNCKDEPQTEMHKCYKCRWWNYSYGCENPKGICKFEERYQTERSDKK